MRGLVKAIDMSSYWTGRICSWLVVAIILVIFYEVVSRYFFNEPTLWSYDMAYYLGGSFLVLGACYVMLVGGNVRIDPFYAKFPRKVQLWIDIIFTVGIFLPLWGIVTPRAWKMLIIAVERGQRASVGYWYPILWPIRLTIALGLTLLLIAGISWLIKLIYELRTGKELRTGYEMRSEVHFRPEELK